MRHLNKARQAHPTGVCLSSPILGAGALSPGSYAASIIKVKEGDRAVTVVWQDSATGDTHEDYVWVKSQYNNRITPSAILYRAGLLPDLTCQKMFDELGRQAFLYLTGLKAEITIEYTDGWHLYREGRESWAIDNNGSPLCQPQRTFEAVRDVMKAYPQARLRVQAIEGDLDNIDKFLERVDVNSVQPILHSDTESAVKAEALPHTTTSSDTGCADGVVRIEWGST